MIAAALAVRALKVTALKIMCAIQCLRKVCLMLPGSLFDHQAQAGNDDASDSPLIGLTPKYRVWFHIAADLGDIWPL